MNENEKKKICVICKVGYYGWGNNALPVKEGYCCDTCNDTKVIPARLKAITFTKKEIK